jgi:1,4-alpha-glucan branching enzyme
MSTPSAAELLAGTDPAAIAQLLEVRCATPHDVLGAHPIRLGGRSGVVVRAFHPEARAVDCLLALGRSERLQPLGRGLFAGFVPGGTLPLAYRLRWHFASGDSVEREDPYRFTPSVGALDQHLLNEGTHRRLWRALGARLRTLDGVAGTAFAVWAPNATRVSLVGDFCHWDGRLLPMRALGSSGIFELFVPGLEPGALYKYEIRTQEGALRLKTDPMASFMECPPHTASRIHASSYRFEDAAWISARKGRDLAREPLAIYEVHLGSFARDAHDPSRLLGYAELAPRVADHARALGFTHVELMPIAEHAYYPSWGYQVTGYFAPSARYGTPDDLRFFVDTCHERGLGVLLDWVPGHFPKDDFSLRRFDGTALYEHEDPRLGEHPDWGTLIFNYGRPEVRAFLISNALYWLEEFHFDGLRVDAVASMLYRDYSRKAGEWLPNMHGGRESLEAIEFLRAVNSVVRDEAPGTVMIAEESTAWGGVSKPVSEGGLGFHFKWNMGWMHDTLRYFQRDPVHRRHHQNDLTFAMVYEHSERFVNPLSHDEVVHGKLPLLEKMPGDTWRKFANLRTLLAYQYTRPGKILLFMGSELAPWREWDCEIPIEWELLRDPMRAGLQQLVSDLGRLYAETPALWRQDPDPEGFSWLVADDHAQSVLGYARHAGRELALVMLNLTPIPRPRYRIGVPVAGSYRTLLSSDDARYGGSGYPTRALVASEPIPMHGRHDSVELDLPPLSALLLVPGS